MRKQLKLWSTCFGTANIPKPFEKLLEWMSPKIVNLKDSVFSPFLCLGLVENVSNVLLHHLLLIARHYILVYTCKLKNSIPKLQVYLQLLLTSMKIEKKIALENSTLNSFERKWMPSFSRLYLFTFSWIEIICRTCKQQLTPIKAFEAKFHHIRSLLLAVRAAGCHHPFATFLRAPF